MIMAPQWMLDGLVYRHIQWISEVVIDMYNNTIIWIINQTLWLVDWESH